MPKSSSANYASKLTIITKTTKFPLHIHTFILTNILSFQSDGTKTVKQWRDERDLTTTQRIQGIYFFHLFLSL